MDERIFSGKYAVEGEIARGGMGVIYKAIDVRLNRRVAIKVLHPQYSSDPSFSERFLGEARAMARLDHENIIRIHAVEEELGSLYIVMEYFAGRDLKHQIREKGPLSIQDAVGVSLQVATALAYAHQQNLIHRDIKPANIMMNQDLRVKIADFGIAAALDEISVTLPGQIIGTPQYMSPEQAKGDKANMDGRSDLYSAGIVMYEMLTGQTPYHDISRTAILGQLIHEREDMPLEFTRDVPSDLQNIIRDLVKRQPQERTADARTLLRELREVAQKLPTAEDPERTELINATQEIGVPQRPIQPVLTSESGSRFSGTAKTDILATPSIKRTATASQSLRQVLKTYNLIPVLGGLLAALVLMAGLIYYLSSIRHTGDQVIIEPPNDDARQQRVEEKARQEREYQQQLAGAEKAKQEAEQQRLQLETERSAREKKLASERAALEADRKRLAEEQARREKDYQAQTAAALRAKEEAERQRVLAERERSEREKRIQTSTGDAERKRLMEEQAQRERQYQQQIAAAQLAKEEAEKQRLEAERERLDREKRLAAERAAVAAERKRLMEERAQSEREYQQQLAAAQKAKEEAEKQRIEIERERAEREKVLSAEKSALDAERKRLAEQRAQAAAADEQKRREEEQARQAAVAEQKRREQAEKERLAAEVKRPKDEKARPAVSNTALFEEVRKKLKAAYERQDLDTLSRMSEMSDRRREQLAMMFQTYSTIKVDIDFDSITDKGASGSVLITELIMPDGSQVMPTPITRRTKIHIQKDGNNWGKIIWQDN